jgi:hypothetical protein
MYFLRSLSVTYYSAVNDWQMFLSVGSVEYLDAILLSPHSWEDFLSMVEGVHLDEEQ